MPPSASFPACSGQISFGGRMCTKALQRQVLLEIYTYKTLISTRHALIDGRSDPLKMGDDLLRVHIPQRQRPLADAANRTSSNHPHNAGSWRFMPGRQN